MFIGGRCGQMIHRLTSLLDDFAEDPMTNQVPFRGQLLFRLQVLLTLMSTDLDLRL